MNNIDNSSPEKNTVPIQTPLQTTGSMRRLLAEDPARRPTGFSGPARPWARYVIPAVLVLTLLVGVGILAYSFGVSRGKGNSNSERDQFLEARAASWNATATAQATGPVGEATAAAIVPQNSFNVSTSVYARVDKIDGAKVSVLLLNSAGQPSGNTATLNIIPNKTQVWRNIPNQTVQLSVGDTVLFAGQPNGTNTYDADTIVVLPASS
jgi:hypothetical protein